MESALNLPRGSQDGTHNCLSKRNFKIWRLSQFSICFLHLFLHIAPKKKWARISDIGSREHSSTAPVSRGHLSTNKQKIATPQKRFERLPNSPNATTWNVRTAEGTDEEKGLVQSCALTVAAWAMLFHPGYFVHILLYISLCLSVMLCCRDNRPLLSPLNTKYRIRNYSR